MAWVHAVIDVPAHLHERAAAFWAGTLGWPVGAPWPGHAELCSFEPPAGRPYVHLQRIDGPPRVHVNLESEDRRTTVEAAVTRGAHVVGEQQRWTALRSPGGLPFCVVEAGAPDPPEPRTWSDGHRSRLVQVCIDSPEAPRAVAGTCSVIRRACSSARPATRPRRPAAATCPELQDLCVPVSVS